MTIYKIISVNGIGESLIFFFSYFDDNLNKEALGRKGDTKEFVRYEIDYKPLTWDGKDRIDDWGGKDYNDWSEVPEGVSNSILNEMPFWTPRNIFITNVSSLLGSLNNLIILRLIIYIIGLV